jgi:hypothetical protein
MSLWQAGALKGPRRMHRGAEKFASSIAGSILRTGIVAAISALSAAGASAGDLIVRYDQSQLLHLPRPASEVIVGNPSIADVTLQDGNLLVVTGKTFGITNVIALDAAHNVIQDQRVMVERDDTRTVNLHKGSTRFTYACTPNCEPTLTIGDDKDFFGAVQTANTQKTKFSEGSSDSSSSANSQQ